MKLLSKLSLHCWNLYKPLLMEKSIHHLLLYLLMPHRLYFICYSKIFQGNTDNSHSVSDHMCSNLCYFRCIYSNNFVLFPFKPSVHLVYWKRLVSTVAVSAGTLPPRLLVITNYTHMKWSSTQLLTNITIMYM